MDINTFLSRVLDLQKNHFFLFFLFSFLTTWIGVALTVATENRLNRTIKLIHASPLFIAPILISKILTEFLTVYFDSTVCQTHGILTILGVIFHSWLAYFLLTNLFNFNKRVSDFLFITRTSHLLTFKHSPIFELALLKFSRPILMTWAIIHVFFESMISPSAFTSTGVSSIVFTMWDCGKEIGYNWLKPYLALITSLIFIIVIYLSYLISIIIEKTMIKKISSYERRLTTEKKYTNWENTMTYFTRFLSTVKCVSAIFHTSIIIITIFTIIRYIKTNISNTSSIVSDIIKIGYTFFSDAVLIGMVSMLLFSLFLIWKLPSYSFSGYFTKKRYYLLIAAILPPVIYGILGFTVTIDKTTYILSKWFFIIFYSLSLFIFFLNWPRLNNQQSLFANANSTEQTNKNKTYLFISSHVFSLLKAFVLTTYIMWTEDGIQTLLSNNDNFLASKIRGFHSTSLTAGTTLGLGIGFTIVICLILMVNHFEKQRFIYINKYFSNKIIFLALILMFFQDSIGQGSNIIGGQKIKLSKKLDQSKVSVTDNNLTLILSEGRYQYTIDTLIIENANPTITIQNAPSASLVVKTLIITGNQNLVIFKGSNINEIQNFYIRKIINNGYKLPSLNFVSINIEKLEIINTEEKETEQDISIESSCKIKSLVIRDMHLNNLSIACNTKMIINLYNIISNRIIIKGSIMHSEENSVSLIINNVYFEPGYNNQPSILEISDLNLITTNISIFNRNNPKLQGPLECKFDNVGLLNDLYGPGMVNHSIEISDLYTSIHFKDLTIGGKLLLIIEKIEDLIFENISKNENASDAIFDCQISKSDNKLPKISLEKIDVTNLKICAGSLGDIDASFRHINVTEEFEISENILKSMNEPNDNKPAFARNQFFKLLESNGRICDKNKDLGLEALYQKKRAETSYFFSPLAFIIDKFTGFGIHATNAIWTFLAYTIFFLVLNFLLINNKIKEKRNVITKLTHAFLYLIFSSHKYTDNLNDLSVHRLSHLYRIVLFIQITLLGIYLGQITLQ